MADDDTKASSSKPKADENGADDDKKVFFPFLFSLLLALFPLGMVSKIPRGSKKKKKKKKP